MANKRQLKKAINSLCDDLLAECVAINYYHEEIPQEDIDNILASILRLQDDMICRVSHIEPGLKPKVFFDTLKKDIVNSADEIIDQLNALT